MVHDPEDIEAVDTVATLPTEADTVAPALSPTLA